MLEEGASPRGLDKAATAFGMPMGPVTLNDLVGLDTSLYAGRVINTAFADRAANMRILDDLVAAGWLGRRRSPASTSTPSPAAPPTTGVGRRLLEKAGQDVPRDRHAGDDGSFISPNADGSEPGAEPGDRVRPGDVDMGLILGIGFPPFRGGILRRADTSRPAEHPGEAEEIRTFGSAIPADGADGQLAAEGKGFYPDA